MLLGLLLTLNILICLALIAVVLLQRSEGGALGTGGNPTGLITTRGAGDLLTRTTWVLFSLFLTISLALTLLGGRERSSQAILDRLKLQSVNPDALPAPRAPAGPADTSAPPPTGATPVLPLGAPAVPPSTRPGAPLTAPTPTIRSVTARKTTPAATPEPVVAPPASAPAAPTPKIAAPPAKIDLSPAPLALPPPPAATAPEPAPTPKTDTP